MSEILKKTAIAMALKYPSSAKAFLDPSELVSASGSAERVVCEYKGRKFTEGRTPNGWPIIHYFEGEKEYGLVNDDEETTIRVLKADIDVRDNRPKAAREAIECVISASSIG